MAYFHIHYELSSYAVDDDKYIEADGLEAANDYAQEDLSSFVECFSYLFDDGRDPEEIEADEDIDIDDLCWEDAYFVVEEISEEDYWRYCDECSL